jgi:hypothetical protein
MKITEETIFNYLDHHLSDEQAELFEKTIYSDKELTDKFNQLKLVHESLSAQKIASAPAGFTERVMNSITELEASSGKFFNRNRIFVLILIGLVVLSTLYYLSIQFYPGIGNMVANQVTLQKVTVDLNPARKMLDSGLLFKLVFYVNGLIGLLLLERAVLKPYFERRKQRFSM